MITLICLDESIQFHDCSTLQNHLYVLSELGDVKREYLIDSVSLPCYHEDRDDHYIEDIIDYIKEFHTNHGYCNYSIKKV